MQSNTLVFLMGFKPLLSAIEHNVGIIDFFFLMNKLKVSDMFSQLVMLELWVC